MFRGSFSDLRLETNLFQSSSPIHKLNFIISSSQIAWIERGHYREFLDRVSSSILIEIHRLRTIWGVGFEGFQGPWGSWEGHFDGLGGDFGGLGGNF